MPIIFRTFIVENQQFADFYEVPKTHHNTQRK